MAKPKKQVITKTRSKPPIKEKYLTPDELDVYWEEYKQWVIDNPIKVQDYVGKDGVEVFRLKQRPLLQDRLLFYRIIHNLASEFTLINSSLQYKKLK